jgi:hypothetical protein
MSFLDLFRSPDKAFDDLDRWEEAMTAHISDPTQRIIAKSRLSMMVRFNACNWLDVPDATIYRQWTKEQLGL